MSEKLDKIEALSSKKSCLDICLTYLQSEEAIPNFGDYWFKGMSVSTYDSLYGYLTADREKIQRIYDRPSDEANLPGQILLTEQEQTEFSMVFDQQIAFIKETTGVDVSARKPPTTKIHVHTRPLPPLDENSTTSPDAIALILHGEIHVQNQPDRVYVAAHESGHHLAFNEIFVDIRRFGRPTIYETKQNGLRPDDETGYYLNEFIIETLTILSLKRHREKTGIDYLRGVENGYRTVVIYFNMLFERMSAKMDVPISTLFAVFLKAFVLGDNSVMSLFDKFYGPGSADKILKYGKRIPCTHFGISIPEYDDAVKRSDVGEEIPLAVWDGVPCRSKRERTADDVIFDTLQALKSPTHLD